MADKQLDSIKSDKFMSIYSNSANLEVTPWDFRLIFGELAKAEGDKPARVEHHVAIIMSPQHAKALLRVLKTNVEEYEKQVGEIKLPQPVSEATPAGVKPQ